MAIFALLVLIAIQMYTIFWILPDDYTRPRYCQKIEALDMEVHVEPKDSTVLLSFVGKKNPDNPNYVEEWRYPYGGYPNLYFIVDNTRGSFEIKRIILSEETKFEFHIPDYEYCVYVETYERDRNPKSSRKNYISDVFRDYPHLNREEEIPHHFYVVYVSVGEYGHGINYFVQDIGDEKEYEAVMAQIDNSEDFYNYERLKKKGVSLGFYENMERYGEPLERERVRISDKSKKRLIRNGWLCVDTLDLKPDEIVEIDTWSMGERKKLTMLYRLENDSIYTPLKGAAYANYMYYSFDNVRGGRTIFYE